MFDNFPTTRERADDSPSVTVTDFSSFVKKTADAPSASSGGGGLFDGDDDDDDDDGAISDEGGEENVHLDGNFKRNDERDLFADDGENDDAKERKIDDLFVAQSGCSNTKAVTATTPMTTYLLVASPRRSRSCQKQSKL